MQSFIVFGLGNIGAAYEHTRHNIGFDIVDQFAQKHLGIWHTDRLAQVAVCKLKGRKITLVKPNTYMNLSGRAVIYWLMKEKLELGASITVFDDLALPLDKIRIRPSGSDAGHNGLKSIQAALGTDAYPKLRFGIGNDFAKGAQADFVLSKWASQEQPIVDKKIALAVQAIETFVLEGIDAAMTRYNKLSVSVN